MVAGHSVVKRGNKNARMGAGVGHDFDELLLGNIHTQTIENRVIEGAWPARAARLDDVQQQGKTHPAASP